MEQQTETLPVIEQGHASLYGDLQHSRDFGDKNYYPNTQALRDLREHWLARRENEFENSPRAQHDIDLILGRLAFELRQRELE
ncbi:MAG TPA: hypothetical protein VF281_03080 [Candidatus Saccharimonadales bacterium]